MMMQKIALQLHADDIIYKPEDIAEWEEYPPDQREAMVAAIIKDRKTSILLNGNSWRNSGSELPFGVLTLIGARLPPNSTLGQAMQRTFLPLGKRCTN